MRIDIPTVQVALLPDGSYSPENQMARLLALVAKNDQLTAGDIGHVLAMGFQVEVLEQVPVPALTAWQYQAYARKMPITPRHIRDLM